MILEGLVAPEQLDGLILRIDRDKITAERPAPDRRDRLLDSGVDVQFEVLVQLVAV